MIKKLFTGRMTSRKRFAGKSDFSAKQVSTTLLLLLLCLLMPQKGWATVMKLRLMTLALPLKAEGATITMSSTVYPALGNLAKYGQTQRLMAIIRLILVSLLSDMWKIIKAGIFEITLPEMLLNMVFLYSMGLVLRILQFVICMQADKDHGD